MKKYILLCLLSIMLFAMGCGNNNAATTDVVTPENENETLKEEKEDDDALIAKYEHFTITSDNLKNGKWDDVISYTEKGKNHSPALAWEPVDGASNYLIYMVDTSMQAWIHWKSDNVTTTNLSEGWAPESDYVGPYPPPGGTHTYEIYVIAVKNPVERMKGGLNSQNLKFDGFIDALDTDANGNTGNIIACAHLSGTFTN